MIINRILNRQLTLCQAAGSSKKRVLQNIAEFIHANIETIDPEELFENLTARERLGSTGIGEGIAIPHCRSSKVSETIGCLIKLKEAVDFDAADNLPVDILFVLIVPEAATDEHLQTLAQLAQLLDQPKFRDQLRKSESSDALFQAATEFEQAA